MAPILLVEKLRVEFPTRRGPLVAVDLSSSCGIAFGTGEFAAAAAVTELPSRVDVHTGPFECRTSACPWLRRIASGWRNVHAPAAHWYVCTPRAGITAIFLLPAGTLIASGTRE